MAARLVLLTGLLACTLTSASPLSGLFNLLSERATIPANPVKVASASFQGLRESSNTRSVRDLGIMGNIGNTYMLSFGDGVGTKNVSTFNPAAGNCTATGPCNLQTARDGGGLPGSSPLTYQDIVVVFNSGCCGSIPQMDFWCPHIAGEEVGQGLGITNVVAVNSTSGVIYTRPTVSSTDGSSTGAGLALVQLVSGGKPKCTRPFGKSTWTGNEPDWGQLSAISDGTYIYAYANGYVDGNKAQLNGNVLVTRVPIASAFDINAYRYWDGSTWSKTRVQISSLTSSSNPHYLIGLNETGQGSIFYSSYYKKYVYICNGLGGDVLNTYAWVASAPQGPWSSKTMIWNDDNSHGPGAGQFAYGGFIMPKYTSADGKTIYFSYTRGGIYEYVIKAVFA